MLRSPSAGRKLGLPAPCAHREVLGPGSMSVPAAHLKGHSHCWPAHAGEGKGAQISELWDGIRLQLVLGVPFGYGVGAVRVRGWFVRTGPDLLLCCGLRFSGPG